MFELKIKNEEKDSVSNYASGALNLLKKITECLSELVEDAELKITESGITIQVLDNIHVCLINIFLSKNLFYSYRCDKVLTLGIKLKVFNKILKNIKLTKDDYFELNSSDEARLLTLKYENSGYLLSYDFKLYDFDMESYSFEEMSYSANVSFNFNDFLFCSKSVGAFDEYLLLDAQKESFNFKQISEAGNSNLTLKPNEESGIVVNVSDPIAKEVNMRYVNLMNKLQGLTDKVTIHIGENIPIFFEFSLEEYGYIRFYVAAKKED